VDGKERFWGKKMSYYPTSMLYSALTHCTSYVLGTVKAVVKKTVPVAFLGTATVMNVPSKRHPVGKNTAVDGFLYAFDTGNGNFKVGKTVNLQQRMRPYRTIHPEGKVLHSVTVKDMHKSEKILHEMLKIGGHHVKQEIFNVEPSLLKEYMNLVVELEGFMRKTQSISDVKNVVNTLKKVN
jgi:hypothetical protein